MDELHRIHKDVPYGYWVEWVLPALRKITRKWRERRAAAARPAAPKDHASVRGQWV